VLLADDDKSVRTAIARLLSQSCDVVGSVADGTTLFEAIAQHQPEVVLLDFSLPGGETGIELCRRIKAMTPEVRVVAFTAHDSSELRRAAAEAGAAAFVWKLQPITDLLSAIRERE
jgi:two-component system response regulator NreC